MMDYESRLRDVESGLHTEDAKFRVRQALKNSKVFEPISDPIKSRWWDMDPQDRSIREFSHICDLIKYSIRHNVFLE